MAPRKRKDTRRLTFYGRLCTSPVLDQHRPSILTEAHSGHSLQVTRVWWTTKYEGIFLVMTMLIYYLAHIGFILSKMKANLEAHSKI